MRQNLSLGLVIGMLMTGIAAPASAAKPRPQFVTSTVFFQCAGGAPVNNANVQTPGWGAARPKVAFKDGGGCIQSDPHELDRRDVDSPEPDSVWAGTVKGNLRSFTVTLYASAVGLGTEAGGRPYWVAPLNITIDGRPVARHVQVEVFPTHPETGVQKLVFSVDGLARVFGRDPGRSTRRHSIELALTSGGSNALVAWTYGASDRPSGITFNPARLSGPVVPYGASNCFIGKNVGSPC